jgi:hypothetical protein
MNSRVSPFVAPVLLCALISPQGSMAQMGSEDPTVSREFGIFLDAAGTESFGVAEDYVLFEFYVVGFAFGGGVLGIEFSVQVPPTLAVMSRTFPGVDENLAGGSPTNVIASTGYCVDAGSTFVLASYSAMFWPEGAGRAPDIELCLGPPSPSSFDPPAPGYLDCDITLVPLTLRQTGCGSYSNGCLILNPADPCGTVPIEAHRFGELKARF